jgi:hypothetical protein
MVAGHAGVHGGDRPWRHRPVAMADERRDAHLFLVLIAGLSAIWTAANTLAILAYRQGPPDISPTFHWTGLVLSASLFLFALTEASIAVLSFRPCVPPDGERAG